MGPSSCPVAATRAEEWNSLSHVSARVLLCTRALGALARAAAHALVQPATGPWEEHESRMSLPLSPFSPSMQRILCSWKLKKVWDISSLQVKCEQVLQALHSAQVTRAQPGSNTSLLLCQIPGNLQDQLHHTLCMTAKVLIGQSQSRISRQNFFNGNWILCSHFFPLFFKSAFLALRLRWQLLC